MSGPVYPYIIPVTGGSVVAFAACPQGLWWPYAPGAPISAFHALTTAGTMDAATEKVAFSGYLYLQDRNASAKTLSAAGGGSISFRTGTCVFADGGTTLEIGLQDYSTTAGPAGQPDGTFDVSRVLTGGAGITTAAWNTVTMTGGSGSKTLSHGDLVSIVWDMTARAGSDSVTLNGPPATCISTASGRTGLPYSNVFLASAWGTSGAQTMPNALITFDDGTLGVLSGTVPATSIATETYTSASTPDERGIQFRVPWDCKIDAIWWAGGATAATSDFDISIIQSPTSSFSSLNTRSLTGEMFGGAVDSIAIIQLASEISLSRNTNYGVVVRATGAGTMRLCTWVLADTGHRIFLPGTTNMAKITRTDGTGDYAAESPATTMPMLGVRISQFPDGN